MQMQQNQTFSKKFLSKPKTRLSVHFLGLDAATQQSKFKAIARPPKYKHNPHEAKHLLKAFHSIRTRSSSLQQTQFVFPEVNLKRKLKILGQSHKVQDSLAMQNIKKNKISPYHLQTRRLNGQVEVNENIEGEFLPSIFKQKGSFSESIKNQSFVNQKTNENAQSNKRLKKGGRDGLCSQKLPKNSKQQKQTDMPQPPQRYKSCAQLRGNMKDQLSNNMKDQNNGSNVQKRTKLIISQIKPLEITQREQRLTKKQLIIKLVEKKQRDQEAKMLDRLQNTIRKRIHESQGENSSADSRRTPRFGFNSFPQDQNQDPLFRKLTLVKKPPSKKLKEIVYKPKFKPNTSQNNPKNGVEKGKIMGWVSETKENGLWDWNLENGQLFS